jgi:REP element-mobilizing transposase RayT
MGLYSAPEVAMPQSLVQIYVHIVFSTKDRQAFLTDPAVRKELHAYLAKTCNNLDCPALEVGCVEDHVHILCRLGKTISVSVLIRDLKRESSKWCKERMNLPEFYWQAGYGAFSISPADMPKVERYIQTQEERHRKETFQEEFRRLCEKYGVALDERYAWD